MLIKALCDYYDILAKNDRVLPDGYSTVAVKYKIALNPNGTIDEIMNCQRLETVPQKNGKIKEKWIPAEMVMPKRTEKPGIDSNIIEHRPLYIFGLNYEGERFSDEDKTGKAKKSHQALVEKNLEFIYGLTSPVIDAYRNFLTSWIPANEAMNEKLLGLGKQYATANFAFCLTGEPDRLLHEDPLIRDKWERECCSNEEDKNDSVVAQCAVSGQQGEIARIHSKIKGVYGGLATGSVLIGFNNASENSYGNDQSYNSNISEQAMRKYTEAFLPFIMFIQML